MGLDISAYSNLTLAQGNEAFDDRGKVKHDQGWILIYVNEDFPGRAEELKSGHAYKYEHEYNFRAGSYTGYEEWRAMLSELAGLGTPRDVWRARKPGPFVELIDFSDAFGVIGASVSAKLAKDFAQYQALADEHRHVQFRALYAKWRKAFELAANNGAVHFQ